MLQGKQLIIATKEFAQENRVKSWYYTFSTLVILCLCLAITLLPFSFLIKLPFSILSGLVLIRIFVIYHDYLHDTILQKSKFAYFIFTLVGWYLLTPKTVWKRSHDYHHKNNSKLFKLCIGSFPVYTTEKFIKCSIREKMDYLFVRHPLTIVFGYFFTFIWGMCINPLLISFSKHMDSFFALILHFTLQLTILYFWGWPNWVLFCLIPHIISGALGSYLFYVQHNFPGVYFASDEDWTYEGSALESSSYLEMGTFMKWVTGNIGYHHIHHLNSRIPFYRLPEVMAHFKELQNPKRIRLNLRDCIACFRLNLWDKELQMMVDIPRT